ncbi:MAG: hypothetical protein EXS38_06130 [Opitutus sp.]|nr:hypothetical protein [Opitutus sp.]
MCPENRGRYTITSQLINARTDEHRWARSFDRELTTANLFAIQAELAVAGNKEAALRRAQKAVELLPESLDVLDGTQVSVDLAFVRVWTGDKNRAIADLARLFRAPFRNGANSRPLNVYWMKLESGVFPPARRPAFRGAAQRSKE